MLALRILRVLKHLSQRELARRAGLPPSTLCRIETGAQRPSRVQLARLAAALAVTPADLLERARAGAGTPEAAPTTDPPGPDEGSGEGGQP